MWLAVALDPPVAHIDLKSRNVMLKSKHPSSKDSVVAMITDFGTSRTISSPIAENLVSCPIWKVSHLLFEAI